MKKKAILVSLLFCFVLALPILVSSRLLYHEILTIVLDDGTSIHLILDDTGMPKPERKGISSQIDFAKAGFRAAVAQRTQEFKDREDEFRLRYQPYYWWWRQQYAPSSQKKKREEFLTNNVNHLSGKFLWSGSGKIVQKRYYYLPPPPRVAVDAEGRPQFTFIKFVTDKSVAEGGASGGILHFLAEYGLTPAQEKELAEKLEKKIEGAKLMGAVPMELGSEESSFRIISATLTDQGFTRSVVSSGKAPIMPGMKVAAAARLDEYGATLLAKTLEKPTSDISIEFDLAYTAYLPAFDGTINVNWEKFTSHIGDYSLRYGHLTSGGCNAKDYYTVDEMHQIYDILCEEGIITIEWTEEIVDERLNMIREAFMKLFTNMFFEKVPEQMMDLGESGKKEDTVKETGKGRYYEAYKFEAKSAESYKNTTYHLRTNLPVKTPYQIVGNINGDWYRSTHEEHPECFDEINIDDPFFQRRKVIFNLDLDAAEIFDEAINHVTVEVRKKRTSGRDFTDSITLNKEYITKNGVSATMTYAKMREDDPGVFEYLTQWSLRGGGIYPKNPRWEKGEWEGVTLSPPIAPLNIDIEADLEELKNNDIAAITVKLRYHKYGKVFEDPETVRILITRGEPLLTRTIFHDRDNAGYDYKVTFHHREKGPFEQDWVKGREDAYIYCYIPTQLKKKEKGDLY
ncbi:MAG: hypothetical protein OEY18_07115 [Candidatus Aminicenantes bacterium]|nr:hypothetical protein [Candidatus Aminicenantes bacterium]MDH5384459.1 hypothetical protein [Candidatus Aminicenantes bacterium]